jgi:inhibitor of KinA
MRVAFGETASEGAHALVRAFVEAVHRAKPRGFVDVNAAYASVLVVIDPRATSLEAVEAHLRALASDLAPRDLAPARRIEIPLAYGGAHGPDLDDVARLTGLATSEVVRRHAAVEYVVAFLGFVPGFAYLSGLAQELRVPRLATPRRRVPPGSLGVAGAQTAVYPLATPGGWRLIGRTPLALFRPERASPSLLQVGDRVSFVPIDQDSFLRIERGAGR